MQRMRVLVVDLLTSGPGEGWYERNVKLPNFSGVMAQVVAVWCEELGSDVTYRTYTGNESPRELMAGDWDVLFVSSYTRTAYTAYAIGYQLQKLGTITVLGGPHAHAFPADALRYFDYVIGHCSPEIVATILDERLAAANGEGRFLDAGAPPVTFPSVRQRQRFIDHALSKTRLVDIVPLLSSTGCPYSCDFCSDADVPYRERLGDETEADIRFAISQYPKALFFWHDPTFGVRFDRILDVIDRSLQGRTRRFGAESTLSLLSTERLARLQRAGFRAMLPGIESWFAYGEKLGQRRLTGQAKMEATAGKINEILSFIPYVQVNFIVGLDPDEDSRGVDLTLDFIHRTPGAWPNLNLATAYGRAAPLGLRLEAEGRILDMPFPLLDQKTCTNFIPASGSPVDLYRSLVTLAAYASGARLAARRFTAGRDAKARIINLMRARGGGQRRRLRWYRDVRRWLEHDRAFRAFFEGDTYTVPVQLRALAQRRVSVFRGLLPPEIQAGLDTGHSPHLQALAATSQKVDTTQGSMSL